MVIRKLQWHPAFSAALRIELEENMNDLDFKDEYQLSKKPMQMDVLVIKKERDVKIKKNIGHIFRTHNIIEYKSPDDFLSVNDFYKVYGYTCFYQSDTERIMEIAPEDITITFVCGHYPVKLLRHLKKVRGIKSEKYEEGIYYLKGDAFPMQLLITPQLSKESNYWLQHLRNDLETGSEIQNLIERYDANQDSKYHQAVMDLIVRANWEKMEEERNDMCDALRELFADELERCKEEGHEEGRREGHEEGRREGREEGREEGGKLKLIQLVCKKLAKGKTPSEIADDLEEDVAVIQKICAAAVQYAPDYDYHLLYTHLNM